MIEKQVKKLYETKRAHQESYRTAQFQKWLLQDGAQTTPEQQQLIKQRCLDVAAKEMDRLEHTTEKRSALWMKEEESRHQDDIRRKLNLCRQIEEKWKAKELLLLTKIGEEVKREARVEERRQKFREESNRKKHVLLEKKVAYHLQKMQKNDLKTEEPEKNICENKGPHQTEGSVHYAPRGTKVSFKHSVTVLNSPPEVRSNTTEPKQDKETTKIPRPSNKRGMKRTTFLIPPVSAETSSVPKLPLQDVPRQEASNISFVPDVGRTNEV
ncbi:fibrous sheath-interacting protein 2-like [Lemur catta]|uniref:fibrous sheath-interacting protein 2-like n=1 Tax=Lemur catta TaxID=9447 RepID=UPI001E26B800|nr:fibrous sheath-interacting protein 2-like [Lemur catta]